MKIISRKEALALGLKRYFTGKACPFGHVCERDIHAHCVECAQEYRSTHSDQAKVYAANHKEERLESSRKGMVRYRARAKFARRILSELAKHDENIRKIMEELDDALK